MTDITISEIRELLKSVEKLAVRPSKVKQRDLLLAPALFKKLIETRTAGVIQIQILINGEPQKIEVTE